jgi:hypothetical protein
MTRIHASSLAHEIGFEIFPNVSGCPKYDIYSPAIEKSDIQSQFLANRTGSRAESLANRLGTLIESGFKRIATIEEKALLRIEGRFFHSRPKTKMKIQK